MQMKAGNCLAVAALVMVAACTSSRSAGPPAPSPSPSPVATDLLTLAGMNSPDLMTPLGLSGTIGGYKVTLVGAYADPVRIVVVSRVEPYDPDGVMLDLQDDSGQVSSSGGGANLPSGESYWGWDTGPSVAPGQVAHFKARVLIQLPTANPATPAPKLIFSFAIRVQGVDHLSTGTPFRRGRFTVTIQHLDVTPGFINLEALFGGASVDDVMGPDKLDLVTAVDSSGNKLRPVAGGGGIAAGGAVIHFQWMRPAAGGHYSLHFALNGATHATQL